MAVVASTNKRTKPGVFQRIARGARRFADVLDRPSDSVLTREVGIVGGAVEQGLSLNSYNPDLTGPEWFRKVDEMLVSSSQAAVIELCVTLPIVSAEWTVKGGDPALRQIVETSLFGTAGMSTTWSEVLYNACGAALHGTAVFEIVWKLTPDGLLIRRLADRDPASVDEYKFDRDGGIKGIVQKGVDPDTGDEVEKKVPIEKLLLFPYRLRRREWHGRSILRPAYRHYESIAMLCTIADIGLDHSLAGLPAGQAPQGATQEDIESFREILSAVRRHEASGLVMPPGWNLLDGRLIGGSDSVGFLEYLQWHEGCFLRAALCGFMQLGSTKSGTTELGGDLMDFSIMAWGGLSGMIAGVFNRHLVRRTCDYNAEKLLTEEAYPEVKHQPIREVFGSKQDQTQAGRFVQAVAQGEEPAPADKQQMAEWMADGLRLPDRDARREGAAWRPSPPGPLPAAELRTSSAGPSTGSGGGGWRGEP